MEKGNIHLQFAGTLLELVGLAVHVEDGFFVSKIKLQAEKLITSYTEFILAQKGTEDSVAQYRREEFLSCIDQAAQIFEDLQYLNLAPPTPLLKAQRILLSLKLGIIEYARARGSSNGNTVKKDSRAPVARTRNLSGVTRQSDTRDKILRFISLTERSRTKDIIEEFSSISERTVKRNLKDLVSMGLLKRYSENKAVYYSAS